MRKLKKGNDNITLVKNEQLADFFARGKATAKRIDEKKSLEKRRVISFEDPLDLAKFLMHTKLTLVSAIRKKPRSLSRLAKDLKRSRSAVHKDVQALETIGIVTSEYVINPGHGRCKMITAVDKDPIHLAVQAVM